MTVFHARVVVRWVDEDAQGRVNNAVVLDYLQQARIAALFDGPYRHLLGGGMVVVANDVEYRHAITAAAGDVDVEVRIGNVRAASFEYAYALHQGGIAVARARTQLCLFDFVAQRPRRLSADEAAFFASLAEPIEPLRPLAFGEVGERAHRCPVEVRWSDLDAYGHVNNVQFATYLTQARVAMRRVAGADAGAVPSVVVARQAIRYVEQMKHRLEPYEVRTAIARVGETSLTYAAEIVDPLRERAVVARGATVMVNTDAAGRRAPLGASLRRLGEEFPAAAQ